MLKPEGDCLQQTERRLHSRGTGRVWESACGRQPGAPGTLGPRCGSPRRRFCRNGCPLGVARPDCSQVEGPCHPQRGLT